ncbi:MAG: sterol desaturase/sphingolipid hydroxylase (fatty acid hydroxylase superfamily) [Halioglobus sp.]|jgi:alkylglycerol monooxygenase
MNFVPYAIPLFVLAIIIEMTYGAMKGRNTYRLNDGAGSLFMGTISQARRFVVIGVGGYVYHLVTEYFSLSLMDSANWFTWVLAFVLYDLCYYWFHRISHERILFWASHVAHHQSEDYNLTTALRQTSTSFLISWIFYVPMYLLGVPAEVVVSVASLNLIYQFWVHSEHIPKLGWYEWAFVTASNHRVHHAQNDVYLDRNYGGVFILWDRLFGTFQEELDEEPCIYGIRGPLRSFNPITANIHIYADMMLDSWRTLRWQDKCRVWVARTGWRPADVALSDPREKNDLTEFEKYDPVISTGVYWYAFFQLFMVLLALNAVPAAGATYLTGVYQAVFIVITSVTTALWLQAQEPKSAMQWDALRIVFLLALAWVVALQGVLLLALILYCVTNAVGLALAYRAASRMVPAIQG